MGKRGNPYGWKDKAGNPSGVHKNPQYRVVPFADGTFRSVPAESDETKEGYTRRPFRTGDFRMIKGGAKEP